MSKRRGLASICILFLLDRLIFHSLCHRQHTRSLHSIHPKHSLSFSNTVFSPHCNSQNPGKPILFSQTHGSHLRSPRSSLFRASCKRKTWTTCHSHKLLTTKNTTKTQLERRRNLCNLWISLLNITVKLARDLSLCLKMGSRVYPLM